MLRSVAVGLFTVCSAASLVCADVPQATIVTRDSVMYSGAIVHHGRAAGHLMSGVSIEPLYRDRDSQADIVLRPISVPGAVVGRALAEQPVYSHLLEMRVGNLTRIYADPAKEYFETNRMPQNHSMARAMRLAQSRLATPARVIRGGHAPQVMHEDGIMLVPVIVPDMKTPRPTEIPSVPAPPKMRDELMALAE